MQPRNTIVLAVKGLVLYNKRALIVHRKSDSAFGPDMWEFPGGKLEFGESPEECLHREIREETGLSVDIERILYTPTTLTHTWRQVVILNFLCHAHSGDVQLSPEHQEYLWATQEQMQHTLDNKIVHNLHRYGIFAQLQNSLE